MRAEITGRLLEALTKAMERANVTSLLSFADVLSGRGYKIRQQDMSAWKRGRIPDLNRLPDVGDALGVSWRWLLVGDLVPRAVERPLELRAGRDRAPDPVPIQGAPPTEAKERAARSPASRKRRRAS